MKHYYIYIKSHCELPDIDESFEAESWEDACVYFKEHYGEWLDFPMASINDYMKEEK